MSLWTDEQIEELRRHWDDPNLSMAKIAAKMGLSRNAVIGKVHRLGLTDRIALPKPDETESKRLRNARRALEQQIRRRNQRGIRMKPQAIFTEVTEAPLQPADTDYVSLRIPYADLRDFKNNEPNECRYIADEPPGPDYVACGNETPAGESYCAHCKQITRSTSTLTQAERAEKIRTGMRNYLRALRRAA